MKRWLLAAACGVVALGLLFYPLVGELLNEKYHSDVETTYTAVIADTDDTELTAQREAAEQYNAMLSGAATITEGGASAPPLAYAQQLTVGGVMAYVDIPKISVTLPIYHGTDSNTLSAGIGHLLGSSLPIGGESTHTILTAHSGMASQKMFSDLDQLGEGDVFYLEVLDEILAYQVDAINTVLPHDTTYLGITTGGDYCATWQCKNGDDYFWGHYCTNKYDALKDLCQRAEREIDYLASIGAIPPITPKKGQERER